MKTANNYKNGVSKTLDTLVRNKSLRTIFFSWYRYFNHILLAILNFTPPPIRSLFLRFTLSNFGKSSFIDLNFTFRYPKKIWIGEKVEINQDCKFYPSYLIGDGDIVIEDNVIIGPGVTLICAGQDSNPITRYDVGGKIIIKSGAYIGANSTIRYGVTIGEGSTVAAGSIVVKSVAAKSIVGGCPAKVIKI
jgi:acetyltransferase-like isoleucine patch superfamily enzyme